MKSYKNINQLIGLALLALIFNACAVQPIQRVEARKHGGAPNNHLTIQQKNDIQFTGNLVNTTSGSTKDISNDEVKTRSITLSGCKGALSYGLTDNLALSSSFNYMDHKSKFEVGYLRNGDGYFNYDDYEAKAVSKDYKAAFHYYLIDTLGEKRRWEFGQFYGAGIGLGTTISNGDLHRLMAENNSERTWIRGVHDSNYQQFFLQANYSLMNRIFDISFSSNISILRNKLRAGQLSIAEKTTAFLWQPSIRTSLGYKQVKLFTQLDWTQPLNKQFLNGEVYLYGSIGLQVKLNTSQF